MLQFMGSQRVGHNRATDLNYYLKLPRWLGGEESTCQEGDMSLTPDPERAPGEGIGNPLQYSCLGNPMDRGVHGVAKSQTQLSN